MYWMDRQVDMRIRWASAPSLTTSHCCLSLRRPCSLLASGQAHGYTLNLVFRATASPRLLRAPPHGEQLLRSRLLLLLPEAPHDAQWPQGQELGMLLAFCDQFFRQLPPRLRNAGARWPLLARLLADWPTGCLQLAWTGRVRPQPADCSVLPPPPASCPTSSLSLGAWRPKAG